MTSVQPATLCYIRSDGRTLMMHRVKKTGDVHHGKWNGIGGKFAAGESPEECVVREIMEETGLRVGQLRFRGVITFPEFTPQTDWLVFVYTAGPTSGDLIESSEGRLEWIDNGRLLELELWEGDRIFLKWLDCDDFFSAKFVYRDKKLVSHKVSFYPARP